jgi:hypothetical protein
MSNKCKSRKYFCDVRVRKYNRVETAESGTEVKENQEIFHAKMKRKVFLTECGRDRKNCRVTGKRQEIF